ncbi:similar to Saccharomyces cerevisiae YDR438W THI74 Mitochondrial transporter repressible by thiamine [Maudiozyma saulgeensis]|uniref:Similar to Saccharomyces cerevisiae YDR438W THI74 Mitochondrial transporter repressible by thiamine n=1 Tax=Maudiozyma saulgeensis TaxID=1789683 RepID=A0A1X7R672_9SACH|nr:similar to Saccharomyces cerevisiae YDR438W THI74 Mitochondrial transporter repressible by thiamine [Kazachstania saulgeensis]
MEHSRKSWFIGLFMILIVILSWVSSSFLLNQVFEVNSYKKPFLITYLNVSSFTLYLIPSWKEIFNYSKNRNQIIDNEKVLLIDQEEEEEDINQLTPLVSKDITSNNILPLTLKETIKLSAIFCFLWFIANFSSNASLSYTSVASQTILSSTSSLFTLFIGAILHVESINSKKLLGLLISFIGIICVTESDSIAPEVIFSKVEVVIGNSLALIGALVYGIYSTFLKKSIVDESKINIKIFFGFVGLFTLIGLWPIILLLHYTEIEKIELPNSSTVIYLLLINATITFISDYCWAKAILLTSPLTVTVGLSLTIPFAMIGDVIFKDKIVTVGYIFGAILVLVSFALINGEEDTDSTTTTNNTIESNKQFSINIQDIENQTHETLYCSF